MKDLTQKEFDEAPGIVQTIHMMVMVGQPIGSGLFTRAMNEHPEYFPEEVARKRRWESIPQSVHDAFEAELCDIQERVYEENKLPEGKGNGGFIEMIENPDLSAVIKTRFNEVSKAREKLFKKYYGPYLSGKIREL